MNMESKKMLHRLNADKPSQGWVVHNEEGSFTFSKVEVTTRAVTKFIPPAIYFLECECFLTIDGTTGYLHD